jgi:hypothetical protein
LADSRRQRFSAPFLVASVMYSLLETAKLHKVDPARYLR